MPRITIRLFFAMLYLGVILLISGWIYYRMHRFEGFMALEENRAERWILRESTGQGLFSTAHRNMPIEVLGLDQPRTALQVFGARKLYDAVQLPFHLQLTGSQVVLPKEDEDHLEIVCGGDKWQETIEPGKRMDACGKTVRIDAITPWSGLIRDAKGKPTLVFEAAYDKEAIENLIFVDDGMIARPLKNLSIEFRWFPNEKIARDAFNDIDARGGRWGIRESGRIHWFESLNLGDGLTSAGGVEYTLVDIQKSDEGGVSGISVEVKDKGERVIRQVLAGKPDSGGEILFEPGQELVHVLCHAWQDSRALVCIQCAGSDPHLSEMEEEKALDVALPDGKSVTLTLLQLMGSAVAVSGENSPVKEIRVNVDGQSMRIREGQSKGSDSLRLAYVRFVQPAMETCQVRASFPKEKEKMDFTLYPGKKYRIGTWKISLGTDRYPGTDKIAVLRVERIWGTPAQWFGMVLFLAGVFGLTIARFADWKKTSLSHDDNFSSDSGWTVVEGDLEKNHGEHERLT